MTLKIRSLASNVRKTVLTPRIAPENNDEPAKSVTIRMQTVMLGMVNFAIGLYECDRSEVVKRAVRLQNAALKGHNSYLTIIDEKGNEKRVQVMIDGVPC